MSSVDLLMCVGCGQPFEFSEGERAFLARKFPDGFREPKRCSSCREQLRAKRQVGANLSCKLCGATFFFSDAEAERYRSRDWTPPLHCLQCRTARRRR